MIEFDSIFLPPPSKPGRLTTFYNIPRLLQIEAAHLSSDDGGGRRDGVDAGDERRGRI